MAEDTVSKQFKLRECFKAEDLYNQFRIPLGELVYREQGADIKALVNEAVLGYRELLDVSLIVEQIIGQRSREQKREELRHNTSVVVSVSNN